jgi:lauroyl/myristoyl acyltransferase
MRTYLLFRLAGFLAPLIPRRLGYALLGVVAVLMYHVRTGNRRMIECNVRRVLGAQASPAEVATVVRRIFHNLLKNYFDLFWLPAQKTEHVARLLTTRGLEHLSEALAYGRGVIVVSAHMGNQEIMTQVKAITDLKLTLIVEHVKNERLFRYTTSLRRTSGIRMIPQDGALREIFRALKRNEGIGLVFDRDVTESGRVLPFFGAPARLPDGYAILSLKLGSPVLPAFVVRQADDSYVVHVEPPIMFEGKSDNDEDVRRAMTSVGKIIERYIRTYVDQWVYFHYVWEQDKQRPEGTSAV